MEFCKDLVGRADGQTDEKEIFSWQNFKPEVNPNIRKWISVLTVVNSILCADWIILDIKDFYWLW